MMRTICDSTVLYIHRHLMGRFSNFIIDVQLAINGKTGVPSTVIQMTELKNEIIKVLRTSPMSARYAQVMPGVDVLTESAEFHQQITMVGDFFDLMIRHLLAFEPISYDSSEINRIYGEIYNCLEQYTQPIVKR